MHDTTIIPEGTSRLDDIVRHNVARNVPAILFALLLAVLASVFALGIAGR